MATCKVVGETAVIVGTFKDSDGNLQTPSTYQLEHVDPSGNSTTILGGSITETSTGILEASFAIDEAGVWRWVWTVVIDGATAKPDGHFCARASEAS